MLQFHHFKNFVPSIVIFVASILGFLLLSFPTFARDPIVSASIIGFRLLSLSTLPRDSVVSHPFSTTL
jgi:hypothetical protein